MDLGIRGRAALVGGGSSGLGRATADRLAAEGCRLAIWSRRADGLATVAADLRSATASRWSRWPAMRPSPASGRGSPTRQRPPSVESTSWSSTPAGHRPSIRPGPMRPAGHGPSSSWPRPRSRWPPACCRRCAPQAGAGSWRSCRPASASRSPTSSTRTPAAARWPPGSRRRPGSSRADGVTINGVLPGRLSTPRIDSLDRGRAEQSGQTIEAVRAGHLADDPGRPLRPARTSWRRSSPTSPRTWPATRPARSPRSTAA